MRRRSVLRPAIAVAALLLLLPALGACASNPNMARADAFVLDGEWDNAIAYYQQRLSEDPRDQEARRKLMLAKTNSAAFHRAEGNKLFGARDLQRAQLELQLAVRLDPTNQAAVLDLRRVNDAITQEAETASLTDIERAKAAAAAAESPVPVLQHRAEGEMTFDYRRAKIQEIYRAIARLGDINVMFDPDLDNDSTSFYLAHVTYDRAWDVLTMTHGHFYRVISPNTILVAPDNQQKRRQYEPQVMRTFYLSNADPDQVATALQTLLQARQVTAIANLNAVAIRDTASVVDVAARMVHSLDKARGEVLLQVEVFEVNRSAMKEWGLSLSNYSTTASILQESDGRGISFADLGKLNNADVFITVPSVTYQFLQQDSSFKLLAQPQLRASDGNEAYLLVGEEVPVVTTTFNPQSTVGGSVVPVSSTDYRPVGIEVRTTPRVHHDGSITLQLEIQVSAVQADAGTQEQPIFTTRTLNTTIRLEEGETNLLAGLLRDDERLVRKGLPIVQDIPVLRDIFGKTSKEVTQTDIVLSITPHIVRMADITAEDMAPVYVGTEANISGGSGGRRGGGRRNGGGAGSGADEEGRDVQAQEPIRVQIQPQEQSGSIGQRLRVDIRVDGSAEINSAGMRVSYNPQVLRLVDTVEGSLMSGDGSETSFQASAGAGSVAIGIGRVGDVGGTAASGVLATLEFEVIGSGESPIQVVSAALRDAQGRPAPLDFTQGLVHGSED